MLNYITSGESHGQYMTAILEGCPSGLCIDLNFVNKELRRRQEGYGRGGRQKIETDMVKVLSGVVSKITTGAPIGLLLTNKDFKIDKMPQLFRPRPGHADLAGSLKYDQGIREVLERASARETAMRVAVGAISKLFLNEFNVQIVSHVVQVGDALVLNRKLSVEEIRKLTKGSSINCVCRMAEKLMIKQIDEAKRNKDSLGGKYEVQVSGLPLGIGSYVHYKRKLDARLAGALMSQQSVKAVEIGDGVGLAQTLGSGAHDEIFYDKSKGYYHKTNHAGGIEGGMSNGSDIVLKVTMKPISTLATPLNSVNVQTKKSEKADFERSDVCAVQAGSVIGEALAAYEIMDAFLEKFGGDSLSDIKYNYEGYLKRIRE